MTLLPLGECDIGAEQSMISEDLVEAMGLEAVVKNVEALDGGSSMMHWVSPSETPGHKQITMEKIAGHLELFRTKVRFFGTEVR